MKSISTTFSSLALFSIFALVAFGLQKPNAAEKIVTSSNDKTPKAATKKAGPTPVGHPMFVSPHANPIAISGNRVFVVNTPADTLDILDSNDRQIIHRVSVGVDPVGVAVRPDQKEVWVSNHVSDSVSVIDIVENSPTYLQVVATIQEFDAETHSTRFDEPVGIAFANNEKAYVALSSENQIAVIDIATRKITKRLTIPAQDPRAIKVRNGRLYVIPFESNNKTQLSGGAKNDIDGKLVTFDAWEHSVRHNNVLSLGHVVDIVKHPDVPDRDLFVFDTKTEELVETVESLGTLLYGLTVDSHGSVFIAQTDARNDINGRSGTKKHDLSQLGNRAFLNQITHLEFADGKLEQPEFIDLEPLPPHHPEPDEALATPFAIEVSDDDSTLVVSAAASDKVFTVDTETGKVLGRVDVGYVPRGIALHHNRQSRLKSAWVLNAVANSVSLVDLSDRTAPKVIRTIELEDPTNPIVKRGRVAFETAAASSTGTFGCASCHPDGHTDQLLWVLKTPIVSGGNQIMPRSTMPVRGLRDTEPFHWDGIPGDPYGGNNSANIHSSVDPNSTPGDAHSSIRHLIDGGLASTMRLEDDDSKNDEGKLGRLSASERDDMAEFLLSVPFPPAQRRPFTNVVTDRAKQGFKLFHIDGDNDPSKRQPNVCGNCHRMPFLVSTNTPGTGMDAPTWRGAYDRFLILPQGRLNIMEFDFFARVAEQGTPERNLWQFSWAGRQRFDPVWDMVLESSTGYSGAFARQVTLNKNTFNDNSTRDLLAALEQAAIDGAVVLEGNGVLLNDKVAPIHLQFSTNAEYHDLSSDRSYSPEQLIKHVEQGSLLVTLTGRHGKFSNDDLPQPAIWTLGPIEKQRGKQKFPVLTPDKTDMLISGRHISKNARIFLNGKRIEGNVSLLNDERVSISLSQLPSFGMHLLQLQNPGGQFSNDFIVRVSEKAVDDNEESKVLGDILRRTQWDRMIGTWVDEESEGKGLTIEFDWRIKNRVLESESIDPERTSIALISVNAQNGDVIQTGADSTGSTHLGKWTFAKDKDAILKLGYTGGDGRPGELTISYKLVEDDKLNLTLELPQPFTIKLIRKKS